MRRAAAASTAAAACLLAPAQASAHGLVGRADLPIPDWLFAWGAAAVLVVSFAALAALWPRPRLQEPRLRPLPRRLTAWLTSPLLEALTGALGVGLLALVVYSGLAGSPIPTENWAPGFVYVAFWLGLVPVSILFGDVFRLFNPWRAAGRLAGASLARTGAADEPLEYPRWLGYWPAVVGLLGFGYLELVAPDGDLPRTVAIAALAYTGVTFVAMALFGVEQWCRRGEAFSVYFGLLARMSPFVRDGRAVAVRPPLSGLPGWPVLPGAVALLATMIGLVSFDGLSAGRLWNDATDGPLGWLRGDAGLSPPDALQLVYAAGIALAVLATGGLYLAGTAGARSADRSRSTGDLARAFVHTLVPIAAAYVAAHYVSLLLLQGQALGSLASDPLGTGADLLGTRHWGIDYGFLGAEAFWYLQVAFVVMGHVAALVLAHDRAVAIYGRAPAAVRSQFWLLGVMVCFTTLALWLLAQAREG